jgi:hypothetical protein
VYRALCLYLLHPCNYQSVHMDVRHFTCNVTCLARSRNYSCHVKATVRSPYILHVAVRDMKLSSVAMEAQEWVPFALSSRKYFVLLPTVRTHLGLHVKWPIWVFPPFFFNQIRNISAGFQVCSIKFHESLSCESRADTRGQANRRTKVTKLIGSYAVYGNAPKKVRPV